MSRLFSVHSPSIRIFLVLLSLVSTKYRYKQPRTEIELTIYYVISFSNRGKFGDIDFCSNVNLGPGYLNYALKRNVALSRKHLFMTIKKIKKNKTVNSGRLKINEENKINKDKY